MAENSSNASPSKVADTPVQEDAGSGNWWDSWVTSAKTKSAEVYSMVKKDLDEIGSAVKSEASHVFNTTSTAIGKTLKLDDLESPANVMKKSFSTFIGQVSTVMNPEPDDEDDTEVILSSGDTTMLSTYKKELEGLQRVDATFLVAVEGPEWEAWRASCEAGVPGPAAAARRLRACATLQAQYDKLVPDAVSHHDFWERYQFRVALLQDRLAAAARSSSPPASSDPVLAHLSLQPATIHESPKKVLSGIEDEVTEVQTGIDNVSWEAEDFAHDVELTEEQQTLLLEEYEKEIASKKVTKPTPSRDLTNSKSNKAATKLSKQITDKNRNNKTTVAPKPTKKETINKNVNANLEKNGSPKKAVKSDVCGNNIVEDYFGEKDTVKDDASANSDESWEKEFEIDDVVEK